MLTIRLSWTKFWDGAMPWIIPPFLESLINHLHDMVTSPWFWAYMLVKPHSKPSWHTWLQYYCFCICPCVSGGISDGSLCWDALGFFFPYSCERTCMTLNCEKGTGEPLEVTLPASSLQRGQVLCYLKSNSGFNSYRSQTSKVRIKVQISMYLKILCVDGGVDRRLNTIFLPGSTG